MGQGKWDRQSATDVQIAHSIANFILPEPLLVFHRELALSRHEAATVAGALSNAAAFVAVVPDFLAQWERPGSDRLGLAALADAIRTDGFLGNRAWRFGLVPGPFGVSGPDDYHLEIRLVLKLKDIIPPASLDATFVSLSKLGEADASFFNAFELLKARLGALGNYPGAVEVLDEVIGPPSNPTAA